VTRLVTCLCHQLEKYLPPESKWELISLRSPSLVSEIVMGRHEVISPRLLDAPIVGGYTPLSREFPFMQDIFDSTEEDPLATVLSSDDHRGRSYVKDLSLVDLRDLKENLQGGQLFVDPLQGEIVAYLRQQSLPPPWVSPFLGKIRSQSVDFDLMDTPLVCDGTPSGCGLIGKLTSDSSVSPLEIGMGIDQLSAVFASSFVYRHLFSALAIRDYLLATFDVSLPLFVLVPPSPPPLPPLLLS
jgi:hypothetical protein